MSILAQLLQTTLASAFGQSARRHRKSKTCQGDSLESRKLLAAMVNARTLKYQDVDGDSVTVTFSKDVLTNANVNQIFKFSTGNVNGATGIKQQLQSINLAGVATAVGVNVTTSAVVSAQNGGNGVADLGQIVSDKNLGSVTLDGDLGRFVVGGQVNSLVTSSIGVMGTATGAPDLVSKATKLGTLTVHGNIKEALIEIREDANTLGDILSLTIDGSLMGGAINSGKITGDHFGTLTIHGDIVGGKGAASGFIEATSVDSLMIDGSIRGGMGYNSGSVDIDQLGHATIRGDVLGASGEKSGGIVTVIGNSILLHGKLQGGQGMQSGIIGGEGEIKTITIENDIIGGTGEGSGSLIGFDLVKLVVLGSIHGGQGTASGSILIYTANMAPAGVFIHGDLIGGIGVGSGAIQASGDLSSVEVGGNVEGGIGHHTGAIMAAGAIGTLRIQGHLKGGDGADSGFIESISKGIKSLSISGDLLGGNGNGSGGVFAEQSIGKVLVGHDIKGGAGDDSACIQCGGKLGSATIGGSLIGGTGLRSARVRGVQGIDSISVTGDVRGGEGNYSGKIETLGAKIGIVTIGNSLIGGSGAQSGMMDTHDGGPGFGTIKIGKDIRGGSGIHSGSIRSFGSVVKLAVGGSLIGGSKQDAGSIYVGNMTNASIAGDITGGDASGNNDLTGSGLLHANHIHLLSIGGSLIAGHDNTVGDFEMNGAIIADADIETLLVKGNIIGNPTSDAAIIAQGMDKLIPGAADRAIGSIMVNGHVSYAEILGGYSFAFPGYVLSNNDAQIAKVKVLGDWTASSISAGCSSGLDLKFGTMDDSLGVNVKDDVALKSRIGNIEIGGQVRGTPGGTDHFGFVAQEIGSLKINGGTITLSAGAGNDAKTIGITGDMTLKELA